jgi:trans-2,3-dihydro-3-hydroxyanthranilate isomerase
VASHRYTLLDVFTDQPLTGNGLAVVHGADDVDVAVMQAVARETRLSETSFIQAPAADGADYRHRIFMIGGEIPFAGHPSLGAAVAVARERGETQASFTQQTQAGLQPIDVSLDGTRAWASMRQEPPTHGAELDAADVLGCLRLEPEDGDPALPVQVVGTGVPQVIAPVRDGEALERAWPDYDAIGPLLRAHAAIVLYVVVLDPESGTARARSFCRTRAEGEDPATGAAAGPLCAYAHERLDMRAVEITQGVEMGRPSRLRAEVEDDRVRVGGDVVLLAEGQIHLP